MARRRDAWIDLAAKAVFANQDGKIDDRFALNSLP